MALYSEVFSIAHSSMCCALGCIECGMIIKSLIITVTDPSSLYAGSKAGVENISLYQFNVTC